MANNNLADLNDHLFKQITRLNDDNLSPEQLEHEIERTKGVCLVANQIISNATLALKATCVQKGVEVPNMLALESNV
ncbi:MAG: hypothetical protein J6R99_01830 [Alphaproteobacteria bacterium]|nr:hypothetical protein [Alphaproteobacteria bacterium]